MYSCVLRSLLRPEESVQSPGTGVTGICELLDLLGTELRSSGRTGSTLNLCLKLYCAHGIELIITRGKLFSKLCCT